MILRYAQAFYTEAMLVRLLYNPHVSHLLLRAALSLSIRIGGVGLMFMAHVLLARAMSTDDYGSFVYAVNAIPLLVLLVQLGFTSASVKYMHAYKAEPAALKGFVYTSFWLPCMLALIGILAIAPLLLAYVPMTHVMQQTFTYGMWAVLLFAMTQTAQQHLRALHRTTYSQIFEQIGLPLMLMAFAGFVLWHGATASFVESIHAYTLCYAVLSVITVAVCWRMLGRHIPLNETPQWRVSEWVRTALPMGVGVIAIALLSRLDVLMLGAYVAPETIAHYGVASRIAALLMFALAALGAVLDPMISQWYHAGEIAKISNLISRVVRLIVLASLLMLGGLYFFGDLLLGMFGPEYIEAKSIMLVLAVGQALNISAGPSASILNVSGHQKAYMHLVLVCIAISAAALALVIPAYGVMGAAIVSATMLIGMNIALGVMIYRKTGIRIL